MSAQNLRHLKAIAVKEVEHLTIVLVLDEVGAGSGVEGVAHARSLMRLWRWEETAQEKGTHCARVVADLFFRLPW